MPDDDLYGEDEKEDDGEAGYADYAKQRDEAYEKADKFSSRHRLIYALAVIVVIVLVVVLIALAFVDDAKDAFSYTEEDVRASLEEYGEDFGYRKTLYTDGSSYAFLGFDKEPADEEGGVLNATPLGVEFCYCTAAPSLVLYMGAFPSTIEAEAADYGYRILFDEQFASDGDYAIVYEGNTYAFSLDRVSPVLSYEDGVVSVTDEGGEASLYVKFPFFSTFSLCEDAEFSLPAFPGEYEIYGKDVAGNETEHIIINIEDV